MIHPSVILGNVKIGNNVNIGAYSIIEENVEIGDNCSLSSHCVLRKGTILGKNVTIDSFAVIGGNPQDTHFDINTISGVHIGDFTIIREGVTIHRATKPNGFTEIGDYCMLMAYSHVAHDCKVGHHVIIANNALLAGHVNIGDHSFLGGAALIHQHTWLGESVMMGGGSGVSSDVPPYMIAAERNATIGLNLISLKRRGFSLEIISDIKRCYHAVYDGNNSIKANALRCLNEGFAKTPQGLVFLKFFERENHKGYVHKREKTE